MLCGNAVSLLVSQLVSQYVSQFVSLFVSQYISSISQLVSSLVRQLVRFVALYTDELTNYKGDYYLTEDCVELAEETDEGESYAPESECTELTVSDIHELEDWYNCEYALGWYTDERYADIMEEVKRLLEVQEAEQTDLVDLIEDMV